MRFQPSGPLYRLIKGLLRLTFRVYYRTIDVRGLERLPVEGPVLLVAAEKRRARTASPRVLLKGDGAADLL